jgi:hypothetical protein
MTDCWNKLRETVAKVRSDMRDRATLVRVIPVLIAEHQCEGPRDKSGYQTGCTECR